MGSSSDQPCQFPLDPLLLSVPTIRMSGSFEGDMNSSIFSYFFPATSEMTTEVEQVEKNCFDKNRNNANVIEQTLDNSSVSTECAEQASSRQSLTEKKRKNRGKKKDKGNSGKKLKNGSIHKKTEQIIKKCKENYDKKTVEDQCSAYIHVRARRGEATDSHSLAERARREKISERMKVLQNLVPGCSKVTGKALVLDEIINYVQSLQNQVEFLSMKLASVTPFFCDISMGLDVPSIVSEESMSLLWGIEDQRQRIENLSGFSMSYFH